MHRLAALILVLAIFALAACGGDSSTAPGDPCSSPISDDIQNRGAPDSRTDDGNTTVLYWGRVHIEYIRQNAHTCFVSNPISS